MKRGLFLVATFTLSSALYAQNAFTRQTARDVFAAYNPVLLEKAAQNAQLTEFLDEMLARFVAQYPQDTLENRYTLIALARNFENSVLANAVLEEYTDALVYSHQGGNVQAPARAHATRTLAEVYPRIWAVSVQVKEDLLAQYKKELRAETTTAAQKKGLRAAISVLEADLKNLHTHTGEQLIALTRQALQGAEAQAAATRATLQQQAVPSSQAIKNAPQKTRAG